MWKNWRSPSPSMHNKFTLSHHSQDFSNLRDWCKSIIGASRSAKSLILTSIWKLRINLIIIVVRHYTFYTLCPLKRGIFVIFRESMGSYVNLQGVYVKDHANLAYGGWSILGMFLWNCKGNRRDPTLLIGSGIHSSYLPWALLVASRRSWFLFGWEDPDTSFPCTNN